MITNEEAEKQYLEARLAIRDGKDATAFLNLGRLYAEGVGVTANQTLANYFYDKAYALGCKDVEKLIYEAYISGTKDFAADIERAMGDAETVPPEVVAQLKERVERERLAGNSGHLSKIRQYLPLFYPEYDRQQAMDDLLNDGDSVGIDILMATCTSDNHSEIFQDLQDRLLEQLYQPVYEDEDIWEHLNPDILGVSEMELTRCLDNLAYAYQEICQTHGITPTRLYTSDEIKLYPFIEASTLFVLRLQAFRSLLSIRDVAPVTMEKYLNSLDEDRVLLDITEELQDQTLQMFLISFVEVNLDIDTMETTYLSLLRAYRRNDLAPLADHINAFVDSLTEGGIEHHLPHFTVDNLPPIDLTDSK